MKKICILTMVILFVLTSLASAEDFKIQPLPKKTTLAGEVEYVPGEILVKFKEGVFKQEISDLTKTLQAIVLSEHRGELEDLVFLLERQSRSLFRFCRMIPGSNMLS